MNSSAVSKNGSGKVRKSFAARSKNTSFQSKLDLPPRSWDAVAGSLCLSLCPKCSAKKDRCSRGKSSCSNRAWRKK